MNKRISKELDSHEKYWKDCIGEIFDEYDISLPDNKLDSIAKDLAISSEMKSTYMGYDCIPDPLRLENEKLKKDLDRERGRTICDDCKGKGGEMSYMGTFQSFDRCSKCNGTGMVV